MRMILFTFYFLGFISNAFSQPNNGVTFINTLPNMTVGQSIEIIIDGNGGGGQINSNQFRAKIIFLVLIVREMPSIKLFAYIAEFFPLSGNHPQLP
jgi:hypothetical protein